MRENATIADDLHPAVRAAAELRASEAGQSLSDYLSTLIMQPSWVDSRSTSSPDEDTRFSSPGNAMIYSGRFNGDHWNLWLCAPSTTAYPQLTASPALDLVCSFNVRINNAAILMSAAFHEAAVSDFEVPKYRPERNSSSKRTWYRHIVDGCLLRSREVRQALIHHWTPTPRAERLAIDAFVILLDLTPARTELLRLCQYDRPRAFSELAKYIDLASDQFRLSADLLAEVEATSQQIEATDEQRFADVSAALLDRAGGGVTLTEGAALLKTSRQALHKRIKLGTALGMMRGSELTLPRFQFVVADGKPAVVDGLSKVVKLFDASGAGRWSALQFLIDTDPNLADVPRNALIDGRIDETVHAARAYLGTLDEA